ncbi:MULTISPECIES: low temperature requirement protein A [unclassified Sinorhizobium]|uniref:low temperature requirement protein A n=1 Tax=unclassified Sinorhizobium TaxID=2613772 RepID=UPI0035263E16
MAEQGRGNWQRAHGDHKVTFIELFFDLVFVFSISQLSHALAAHFTVAGALEATLLTFAIWWVWIFTAWVTNWLAPEKMPVRTMLVVLMMAGLVLSASIPEAFGDKGLLFAGAYVFMQVGRSLFATHAFKAVSRSRYLNFLRIAIWLAAAGLFWIAGALVEHEARLILWIVALAIEYIGPATGFRVPGLGWSTTQEWNVSGAHMAERCALFIIICLGEAVLVSGRTFSELPFSWLTGIVFVSAFVGTVAMWWLYFRFGHRRAAHRLEHAETPGSLARQAFTYAHIPVLAGIILHAVAVEFMFSHPHEAGDLAIASAIIGAPVIFLLGNLWFKGATTGRPPLSHFAGLVLLILIAFAAPFMESYLLGILATLVLIVVAAWEYTSLSRVSEIASHH